jgi:hypothetical protein
MINFKLLAIKNTNGAKDALELCNFFEQIGADLNDYSCKNDSGYYIINENGTVEHIDDCNINGTEYAKFTFSAFKTLYPYVLDEIINLKNGESVRIFNMYWNGEEMVYEGNADNGEITDIKLKDIILKPDIDINKETMNKKLAIKGHPTRNKEVIELLEMMGGNNFYNYGGKCVVNIEIFYFFIDNNNSIRYDSNFNNNFAYFTIEEFLEKYPFKVGDFVNIPEYESEVRICKMKWCEFGYVEYLVYRNDDEEWYTANELMEYNDEFLADKKYGENDVEVSKNITLIHPYEECVKKSLLSQLIEHIKTTSKEELEKEFKELEDWSNVGPTVEEFMDFCNKVNKRPKYPTTYDECYDEVNTELHFIYVDKDERDLYESFIQLIRCRNAYWKIAGEELGLGKPWEPDWNSLDKKHNIYNYRGVITVNFTVVDRCILIFPTKEIRDTFYRNFSDLIEKCKELL